MVPQQTGIAFSVEAETFMTFAARYQTGSIIRSAALLLTDLVTSTCLAFISLIRGKPVELNCYDYDRSGSNW